MSPCLSLIRQRSYRNGLIGIVITGRSQIIRFHCLLRLVTLRLWEYQVYPDEKSRAAADGHRDASAESKFSVREIVPLKGKVLVHFHEGRLVE